MFLVFQLRAPLGAFGNAQAEVRHTSMVPRRSAVLGLLAAALGLDRSQAAEFADLSGHVAIATAELREPHLLMDFHTVQAPVALSSVALDRSRADQLRRVAAACRDGSYCSTIVTQRAYLQDGHWLIAVTADSEERLNQLHDALEHPRFALYLGRKSCPLSAFTAPLVVNAQSAEDACEAWAEHAKVKLPECVAMTWEPAVPVRTLAATQVSVTDQRHTLQYPHFSPRIRREGNWIRQESHHVPHAT